jgi:hypothetical protein
LQVAAIGTCGALSVVNESDGYAGKARYFDASGALVAVEAWSDTNSFCDGTSFSGTFGAHAPCAPQVGENLCPRPPPAGGP